VDVVGHNDLGEQVVRVADFVAVDEGFGYDLCCAGVCQPAGSGFGAVQTTVVMDEGSAWVGISEVEFGYVGESPG
jgi:hypothetical protein